MDWSGWALFGLVATTTLTAIMIAAQMMGLTRLDLPLLLGTLASADPDRARAILKKGGPGGAARWVRPRLASGPQAAPDRAFFPRLGFTG